MESPLWLATHTVSMVNLQLPGSYCLAKAVQYNDNPYIRTLNQILRLELACVELYSGSAHRISALQTSHLADDHLILSHSIVHIIRRNRGLPSKTGFAFSSELSLLKTRLTRHLPEDFAHKIVRASCLKLETSLQRRYCTALTEAPYRDRHQLNDHVQKIHNHIAQLELHA